MTYSLNKSTQTIAAATTTAVYVGGGQLDWRFSGQQNRRVVVVLANGADSVLLEGTLDGTTWFALASAFTGATTPFVTALSGPYYQIRVTKTGTNGAATISAIV